MKKLILLLDGSWNDADFGERDSNIVRMRNIINLSLDDPPESPAPTADKLASGRGFNGDGCEHLVFYERGVGTGAKFDVVGGGAFGEGLEDNIRRAYKFLSFHYQQDAGQPGEDSKIYIFGFSRGAYTARTLAGYIHAAGLLTRESCTPELEQTAWNFYRTAPADRLPAIWSGLTPYVHRRDALKIEVLGVFDTVGALGIPLPEFWWVNRERYGFHNVELNALVRHNLQALAIDEHRTPFQATPWRKMPFKHYLGTVEQVWFAGCHTDIGGSRHVEKNRPVHALDDLALDWMLKRLNYLCPEFPVDLKKGWKNVDSKWRLAEQHEARTIWWTFFNFGLRAINNIEPPAEQWKGQIAVNYDRHATPAGEMVHISAIERLGAEAVFDEDHEVYLPVNLLDVLEAIRATYDMPGTRRPAFPVLIVDWDGHALTQFGAARERAVQALAAAQSRLDHHAQAETAR